MPMLRPMVAGREVRYPAANPAVAGYWVVEFQSAYEESEHNFRMIGLADAPSKPHCQDRPLSLVVSRVLDYTSANQALVASEREDGGVCKSRSKNQSVQNWSTIWHLFRQVYI